MASNEKRIKSKIRNAYLVSTVSIALVLFLLGAVSYLIINAKKASNELRENITLSILLKDEVSSADTKDMMSKVKAMEEVKKVEYISKEVAAKDFKDYIGNDFVTFLEGNPLPASLELTIKADFSGSEYIKKIDKKISKFEGVDDIIYQQEIIEQVTNNIGKFNLLLALFGGTLLLISLILINNTIRMAIFSKRFIINTMKLVGATRGFILRPFIVRALAQGLYAALIAIVLICGMVYGLNRGIPEAGFITGGTQLATIFAAIIAIGIVISVLFTYGAVSKYVRLNANQIHIY